METAFRPQPYSRSRTRISPPSSRFPQGNLSIFAVNRSPDEGIRTGIRLDGLESWRLTERLELAGFDPKARNTAGAPDAVIPRSVPVRESLQEGVLTVDLPPLSWNILRLSPPGP